MDSNFKKNLYYIIESMQTIKRWRQNTKFCKFVKLRQAIAPNILINIPFYGEALLRISKLVQEITRLNFLPDGEQRVIETKYYSVTGTSSGSGGGHHQKVEEEVRKKIVFTLESFNEQAFVVNKRTGEILEHLFAYVRYVLDHTRKKYYDKLRFYEKLVNEVDPMYAMQTILFYQFSGHQKSII